MALAAELSDTDDETQIAMNPVSTPSLPEIIEQTNRVLNSSGFRNSANQARLLEFAITKALANEPISQKDIVKKVWESTFIEPGVVKSTANIVRGKLQKYYENEGSDDPVIVTLLAGRGYKAQFSYNSNAKVARVIKKALFAQSTFSEEMLRESYRLFHFANSLDPGNPRILGPWSETALMLSIVEDIFSVERRTGITRSMAVRLAIITLANDPKSSKALSVLAFAQLLDYDWESASELFNEAYENDPAVRTSNLWGLFAALTVGPMDESRSSVEQLRYLNPTSIGVHLAAALMSYLARDHAHANDVICEVEKLGGTTSTTHLITGLINSSSGYHNAGYRAFSSFSKIPKTLRVIDIEPIESWENGLWALAHEKRDWFHTFPGLIILAKLQGNPNTLDVNIAQTEMKESLNRQKYGVKPMQLAIGYTAMGKTGRALVMLRRALNDRDIIGNWIEFLHVFDPLRSHPIFQRMVADVASSKYKRSSAFARDIPLIKREGRYSGECWPILDLPDALV